MNKKLILTSYILLATLTTSGLVFLAHSRVVAAEGNTPISKSTTLHFDNLSESQEVNLQDFMDQRMKTPSNCYNPGVICKEKIQINFVREWEPVLLENLSPDEFAKLVPPITETLGRNTDSSQVAIAQRVLTMRGLLLDLNGEPIMTLGNWRHLSEMARARLSYIKGKELTDDEFITEINGLIERMKEPGYISGNPLPSQIDPQAGQIGFDRFNEEREKAELALKQKYKGPNTVTIKRRSLELDGSVKLYTTPGRLN
ncbi:MAG: hypothetical protein P1V18_02180 [Candidatus Gracilibacteria bacterium]|nr:hypothetical protein [Candidatus Gracilibacteria bacterium]